MNTRITREWPLTVPTALLTACLLVLTAATAWAQTSQVRWLRVGSLHSWYSRLGCEMEIGRTGQATEQNDGLRWPAQYQWQNTVAGKGMWLGTTNYFDRQLNTTVVHKVVAVGPRTADPAGLQCLSRLLDPVQPLVDQRLEDRGARPVRQPLPEGKPEDTEDHQVPERFVQERRMEILEAFQGRLPFAHVIRVIEQLDHAVPDLDGITDALEGQRVLSLAVVINGEPNLGLLPFAVLPDHTGVLVHVSSLARHTQGLTAKAKIAVLIHQPLVLVIAGGVFVMEAASVIIQTGWFRYTRRRHGRGARVFLMAPIHHHFEKKGWYESQVVTRFYILCILCAVVALSTLKLR